MLRKTILIFLFVFLGIGSAIALPNSLKIDDIHRVMERLFSFHIESKELTTTLIRRSMKLYIEQFDPEKAYLLESEAAPYLHLTEGNAQQILGRLKNQDYSDFLALNEIFQNAIVRAREAREQLSQEMIHQNYDADIPSHAFVSQYASTEDDLALRQKNRMVRFYLFQKARAKIDTQERRSKVYSLFEKKVHRVENNYLFLSADDQPLSIDRVEHLLATPDREIIRKEPGYPYLFLQSGRGL